MESSSSLVAFLALCLLAASAAIAVLKKALKASKDEASNAAKEAARVIQESKATTEREIVRLGAEALARLAEVDALVANERAEVRAEAQRIERHYEAEARKLLITLGPLKKYQGVADAEQEAQRMLEEAVRTAKQLRDQSQRHADQLTKAAVEEVRDSETKIRALRAEAGNILSKATEQARKVVDDAHKRAEEIGGAAYVALREKDSLQGAVVSIRNVIDGYGDRYVVPTHSVLDELGSDYGHVESGAQLQAAREYSRRMVEEGHAAECDYAEAKRKETAVRFVVDAFNGRADGILSRTKHDNIGTLTQEIRDAFALVNLNGEAFRNARILPAYLDARLAELKWAVATQELRLQEREEQRRIQETIREEEKAQREIDRALKEAEREEETLKKAMEKARAEVAAASLEDKAMFEGRLAELNTRLAEAEAKNQRALSMAQQTRAGHVYVISNLGSFGEDVVKIGMTRRLEPLDRVRELGDASVPFVFDVHAMIYAEDAPKLERELHDRFEDLRMNRVNYRKEFFRIPVANLREFVAEKGLHASFTMVAEAREFRESVAISKMSKEEAMQARSGLRTRELADAD